MLLTLLNSSGFRPTSVNLANLYRAPQQVDNFVAANPELAPIANQPQAKWINTQGDADGMDAHITAAAGKTTIFSIYGIPGRDAGGYSAGGFPDRASYLNYISTIKSKIGSTPSILLYEPDALGHTPGMSQANRDERIETMRQAVNILATIPNAEVYAEASQWIDPTTQAGLLKSIDVAKIHGFLVNTSGYDAQSSCYSYSNSVITQLEAVGVTGKKFVVDSSRNGNGPLTEADRPLASPWLDTNQAWCNPPKRALGLVPGPVSGQPNCRATLWVKNAGESDGTFPTLAQSSYFGESAPAAGQFWLAYARDLLGLTPQKAGAVAGSFAENCKADFTSGFGALVDNGELTLTGGRARLPITTNYPYAGSASTYTVVGNTHQVELVPGPAATGTTEQWTQFIIESTAAPNHTRVRFQINIVDGNIQFADDVNYSDSGAVTIPYSATTHRFLRFREAGGTLYWETSPSGKDNTWTVRRSKARPSWMTATANQKATFTTHAGTGGSTSYVDIDNLNVYQGAAPALRDISTIPDMNGWWKADSLSLADGAQVSAWADSSPGARNATQAATDRQPVYVANALNSLPVVRFTSDRLDTSLSATDSAQTIFAVAKPTSLTRINTIIGAQGGGGRQYRFNEEGRIEWLAQAEEGTTKSSSLASTTTFKIATGSITGNGAYNYWFDGAAAGGGSWGRTFTNPGQTSSLGFSGSTNGEEFIGDIAEIISFNRVLTASERAQVHSYLQDKYSIAVSDYVAAGGGTTPPAATTRTNLMRNPSFEVNITDGPVSTYGAASASSRDTTQAYVGTASLKITAPASSDLGDIITIIPASAAAGTYTFSAWMKTDSVDNNAALVVRRSDNYGTIGTEHHVTGTTGWTRKSITFTTPGGVDIHVVAGLGSYGSASGGTMWLDGMLLETGSTVGPYFDGGTTQTTGAQTSWSGTAHNSASTETAQVAFTGTGATSGEGTAYNGTPVPRFIATSATSASGTATGAGAPRFVGAGAASGDGTDAATGSPRVIVAGDTSATGTAAATGTVVAGSNGATSAEGTDVGSGVPRFISTVATSANSTTAASGTPALVATVAATGSGTAGGTGRPAFATSAATDSAGTSTATGGPSYSGAVATSGEGTTAGTGVPRPATSVATSGAGTSAASGTPRTLAAVGTSGQGTASPVTARPSFSTAVATSGEGTADPTGSISYSGTVATSGEGTATSAASAVRFTAAAAASGSGTATTSARLATSGTGSASGAGTSAPSATVRIPGTADSTSEGTTSSSVSVAYSGTAASDGSGTVAGSGQPRPLGSAAASGAGTATGAGVPRAVVTVGTSADGTDAATGAPRFVVTVSPSGDGTDAASGRPRFLGTATPSADGTDAASGNPRFVGSGAAYSVGSLNTAAQGSASGSADASGAGTATSSATVAVASSAGTSAAGTAAATGSKSVAVTAGTSGVGTVTTSGVSPRLIGSGGTSASGTTAAGAAQVAFVGAVGLASGDGVDSATGRPRFVVTAYEDSNSGATTQYSSVQFASGEADATGEGSLAQGYTSPRPLGTGSTSGAGTATASGRPRFLGTGAASGAGNDSAVQSGVRFYGAAFPSGLGVVVGDGVASVVTISASRLYELTLQRRNTRAYIASDPTTVVLRRESFASDGAGGYRSTVVLQSSQIFRIISSGNVGSNQRIDSVDGANTQTAATLLAEWDADLKVNDEFDVDAQRFKVRSVTNLNSYELFADLEIVSL